MRGKSSPIKKVLVLALCEIPGFVALFFISWYYREAPLIPSYYILASTASLIVLFFVQTFLAYWINEMRD